MGGFLWDSTDWADPNDHWTYWRLPYPGNTFPSWTWKPDIIWGPGSMGHVDDINAYGIWKPSAATNHTAFVTHDGNEPLSVVGNGCAWVITDTTAANPDWMVNSIIQYADYAQSQAYSVDKMFNATIQTNFKHYTSAGYQAKVMYVLNGLKAYVSAGKIEYKTIEEKYAYWYSSHAANSTANHVEECSDINLGYEDLENLNSVNLFPNPANTILNFTSEKLIESISMFNSAGACVNSKAINNFTHTMDISSLSKGIYLAKIQNSIGTVTKKIIVE